MSNKRKKNINSMCISEDSDEEWKEYDDDVESLKKKDKLAHKIFLLTKKEIENSIPTLMKILKSDILLKDRAIILQYYDIYCSTEKNSEKGLELQQKINKLLVDGNKSYVEYNNYTSLEHNKMENDLLLINNQLHMENIQYRILNLNTNISNKSIIYNKYKRFCELSQQDDEYYKIKHWLWWALELPYSNITSFNYNSEQISSLLLKVNKYLNQQLYGMEKVKEQILLFLNCKLNYPNMKNISLGLLGSPGTGKTKIAKCLSKVLEFPFEQISLGGVKDSDFLKGHSYTYVGSQPGEIVRCLRKMKSSNGILFFDEYDKISDNKEINSSLLHITDYSQNMSFNDNFLDDIQIDLSNIWFIYSMNDTPKDNALKDRIFIIEIPDYSIEDKINIVKNYIIPTILDTMNLPFNIINIDDKTILYIINTYTENSGGIRPIEWVFNNILRKIGFLYSNKSINDTQLSFYVNKINFPYTITEKNINKLI